MPNGSFPDITAMQCQTCLETVRLIRRKSDNREPRQPLPDHGTRLRQGDLAVEINAKPHKISAAVSLVGEGNRSEFC